MKTNGKRTSLSTVLTIFALLAGTAALTTIMPVDPKELKAFSLIPAVFLIVYILFTKRVVEGLVLSSILGIIMISRPETVGEGTWAFNAFSKFSDTLMKTLLDEDIVWLIIVCGLMGSIIALLEKSGGAFAFGEWASKRAKDQKTALVWVWILGIVVFIDDYLNSLTVGSCMTNVTDKYKTPREYLAYIVDSTAAPACALIPISTWAVFVAKILETNKWAPEGEGLAYFIKTIPYNFYSIIALFIVPMVIYGIVPIFGPMKQAVERVNAGGPLAPAGSEKIDIRAGKEMETYPDARIIDMFIPIAVLVGATVFFDNDMQLGVLFTMGFMFVYNLSMGHMTPEEFVDVSMHGFKNMCLPLLLMVLAFLFGNVNKEIYFTDYVIKSAAAIVNPTMLPFVVFLALGCTEFIMGSNWGMYIIALPIVIPLAQSLNANMTLSVAAVLSAGVFGSHICFYSDATVITSAACGCDNLRHSITQFPFGLLAAFFTAILYLGCGIMGI